MEYADRVNLAKAADIVLKVGKEILHRVKERTDWLYPLRKITEEKLFGYLWTYRLPCPDCGIRILLSKRPWLSRKKKNHIGFVAKKSNERYDEQLKIKEFCNEDEVFSSHWEKRSGIIKCPYCNAAISDVNVLTCDDTMVAYISNHNGAGKTYAIANQKEAFPSIEEIEINEKELLNKLGEELPNSQLPVWSGIVNPALYGIKTHADVLNRRQRLLLLYLLDELIDKYLIMQQEDENMARFVMGALSSLIDQVIDWNCRLSMWISQNEQVGRGFCGPGIAMLFDYAETDQLLKGPANLWDKLQRIYKGILSFENCPGYSSVIHAHAQDLPFEDGFFDAIVTDPPYYDNIYYSVLADFFYAWKKMLLKRVAPELFCRQTTDYKYELVASSRRTDAGTNAHETYCLQLNKAFSEAGRVLKHDGIFSFVYSHSSVNGWEAIVRAYRQSCFYISSVQPLSIERKGRPRAILSQAVNTCMAFIARKSNEEKRPVKLSEILSHTRFICTEFGKQLEENSGWTQADAGMAVIAHTVALLANSSEVVNGISDAFVIREAAKLVKNYFPEFSIKMRDSL